MSGVQEVEAFLTEMGLEHSIQAVVHNGFYTSMEALKGATYEELVDSGVRPVHAKLIISHLGSRTPLGLGTPIPAGAPDAEARAEEVATFLRSVGLENCQAQLTAGGFTSLEALGEASMQELLAAGLKPVHARLIVSNLDSASSAGINMTPANQRVVSLDEESLLGGPQKRKSHRARWYAGALLLFVLVLVLSGKLFSGGTPADAAAPLPKGKGAGHKGGGGKEGGSHSAGGSHVGGPHLGGKAKGKGANVKTVEDRDVRM